MQEKKIDYTSEARVKAHKKYMSKYVEVKVRMTPERRQAIQDHASKQNESTNAFINRAIDETIEADGHIIKPADSRE